MGRRIDGLLCFIRLLRTTDPKYSFEVFIFNITLGLACTAFAILGENRLWALTFAILSFSLAIQYWRVRRVVKRQLAFLERMLPEIEQAIAALKREEVRAAAREREPDAETTQLIALLHEDVERAKQEPTIQSE